MMLSDNISFRPTMPELLAAATAQKRLANSADDSSQPRKILKKAPDTEVLSVKNEQLLAAVTENSVGFSGEKKLTQATDIKFGDTFRTISSVFSEPLLKQVNQEIDDDNSYFHQDIVKPFLEDYSGTKNIKSSKVFNCLNLSLNSGNPIFHGILCSEKSIRFDDSGHLMNKETFQKECLDTSSNPLRTLCSDALEKMADEFQWRGRSVEVDIFLVRYPLIPSRGIKGLPWHKDFRKKSMVVQLNDNTNATGAGVKYSGGGLNIGQKGYRNLFRVFPVKGTEENNSYGPNNGFIFSNKKGDLIHQAEDIVYLSENNDDLAEKRIIVVLVDD